MGPTVTLLMDDEQLIRYSRHILLDELGIEGQARIRAATALVIGAGGLGSPAALYLASAGIGRIIIADHDRVDLTNLQRQILHTTARVGQAKVASARTALADINPEVQVEALEERLDAARLDAEVARSTVVLDCSDNFATRHAVNRACVRHRVPLVSGAAIRFDGQISVFDLRHADAPCYHCLFPEGQEVEPVNCATMGVFAPLTGIIGCTQAAEALKLVAGIGTSLSGRLLLLDALSMQWTTIGLVRDPGCAVCATKPE